MDHIQKASSLMVLPEVRRQHWVDRSICFSVFPQVQGGQQIMYKSDYSKTLITAEKKITELRTQRDAALARESLLVNKIKKLERGIKNCLENNLHLADGEDCTLIDLKRLLADNAK